MHNTTAGHTTRRFMAPREFTLQVLIVLLLTGFAGRVSFAHDGHAEPDPPLPDPPMFVYDAADRTVSAQAAADVLSYDADILTAADGQSFIAWLQFVPHQGDTIWFGNWTTDGVANPIQLEGQPDDQSDDQPEGQPDRQSDGQLDEQADGQSDQYAHPTLSETTDGLLWLSYEHQFDGQWDVFVRQYLGDGKFGDPRKISESTGSDIQHEVAVAGKALWFTWQSDHDGQFDIVCRRASDDSLGELMYLSDSPRGDWHPQIAVSPTVNGEAVFVAWDRFDGESYDVVLRIGRILRDGRTTAADPAPEWAPPLAVAGSPVFEGRVQLARAPADGVWIAWEEGAENWGQPYRARRGQEELYLKLGDTHGPLHRYRHLRLGHVSTNGRISAIPHDLPQPSYDAALHRGNGPNSLPHGAYYERGKLALDGTGRLWIAYRHFYAPWMGIAPNHHVEEGWGLYARCLTDVGWSELTQFDVGQGNVAQGDGMQRLELAAGADGITAVWTAGRTDRRPNDKPRGVHVAAVTATGNVYGGGETYASVAIPAAEAVAASETAEITIDGRQPYFGDLHRHTDLSLCFVPIDGTIDDAYRYASDVARLDFLGITDHTRDIMEGDALSLLWWRCQKQVGRYELPKRFLPFYAYERSRGDTDHNVISLRSDMLRPHTYPLPEFWQELGDDTFTIPHQPFNGVVWEYQDDVHRPLLEIFQGFRDRSIETDAHEGLDRGYHFGFIASSDHLSTRSSYAGVWADERSRESLFAAMKSRRTFGATDRITLAVRCGDHWMGEQLAAAEMPPLEITVAGTAPVRTIDVIVDGQVQQTLTPLKRRLELSIPLSLEGQHYIYIRLQQSDGNQAWSSPIWVTIGG